MLSDRMGADGAQSKHLSPQLGEVDHVTLLPNRVSWMRDMAQQMAGSTSPATLVLLTLADASHFNQILRALGHAFADDFVRMGAATIAGHLDAETTLYHVSVLSFAFVVPDQGQMPPAIVEQLVLALRAPLMCGDLPIATRVGIGIVSMSADSASPAAHLRSAVVAAQDSRRTTEGWASYDRRSDEAHQRAFQLLPDLRQAIDQDRGLSLSYQPRMDLHRGTFRSAEALVRWEHDGFGAVSPAEFIPLAETTALMAPLNELIINHALRFMRSWPREWAGFGLSVNISPRSLEDPGFVDLLGGLFNRYDISPERVELEFTEGAMTSSDAKVQAQISRLREMDVRIAIDDFGTGYSNFQYLTDLPAQVLKLDKSFILPLDQDPRRAILVHRMIDLAHDLGFSVVAEGVETEQTLDRLRDWGCDEAQGYFLSRPLPTPKFQDWLAAQHKG